MVERIKWALVRPWISSRMKTFVTEVASVHLANEREGAVEMGIPGY
jgi:hypothetical protein